jgi:hypothetical protein
VGEDGVERRASSHPCAHRLHLAFIHWTTRAGSARPCYQWMMRLLLRLTVVVAMTLLGCSDGTTLPPPVTSTGNGGTGGGGAGGGGAGGGDDRPCPVSQQLLDDGSCLPPGAGAGIDPANCPAGFQAVDGGCVPTMPGSDCAPGTMAIPGDTSCRPVAPCGAGPWGDIPTDGDTQFVNVSYGGNDSDGTSTRPWTSIQVALGAALPGATVAVAAGNYVGPINLTAPVTLWGVCPANVTISSNAFTTATVNMLAPAEVRGVSITGLGTGIRVLAAPGLIDGVRVHDTASGGVHASAQATISRSLVESTGDDGINVSGAAATIEETVVRDAGDFGVAGVNLGTQRATVDIRASVVRRAYRLGVFNLGSDVSIQDSVVVDTRQVQGQLGIGVYTQTDPPTLQRGNTAIVGSYVGSNHLAGISFSGADGHIETTTVVHNQPIADGRFGRGVFVRHQDATGAPSSLTMDHCLVAHNHSAGVGVLGSHAVIDSTVIRDTQTQPWDSKRGRGLNISAFVSANESPTVTLRNSVVIDNREAGVSASGTHLVVEGSVVSDTLPQQATEDPARGISCEPAPGAKSILEVRHSSIERNGWSGISALDTDVEIDNVAIRDTAPPGSPLDGGIGIAVQDLQPMAGESFSASILRSEVRGSRGVGIYVINVDTTIEDVDVIDVAAYAVGEGFGDGISVLGAGATPTVSLRGATVGPAFRAGLSVASANVSVGDTNFDCNPIDLNGESFNGPFDIEDVGGTRCGCDGQFFDCKVLSAGLLPPDTL